jgi:hypothetical protein
MSHNILDMGSLLAQRHATQVWFKFVVKMTYKSITMNVMAISFVSEGMVIES